MGAGRGGDGGGRFDPSGICGKLFVSFESVQAPVNGTGDRGCECDGRERRKEVVEHADSGVVKRREEKLLVFKKKKAEERVS